jgi:phage terminase small subunit
MADKLTAKQEAFVSAYCSNGFNATQACISAGYSKKTAKVIGAENLSKPNLKAAIKKHTDKTVKRNEVTVDSLIAELEEARTIALGLENPQTSAAINATMGKAKLTGLDQRESRDDAEAQSLNITFGVADAVKEITVTKGK